MAVSDELFDKGGAVYNVRASGYGVAGDGSQDDGAALNTLFSTTIPASGGTAWFPPGTYRIDANLTVPAHVAIAFAAGARIKPLSNVTVTINGPLQAPLAQIFDTGGGGQVVFGPGVTEFYRFEWWGARADATNTGGGTDSTGAITAAIAAIKQSGAAGQQRGGGAVALANKGYYRITSTIVLPRQQVIDLVGAGRFSGFVFAGSTAAADPASFAIKLENTITQVTRMHLANFSVYCPEGASGIHLNNETDGNGYRWCRFDFLLLVGNEAAPFSGTAGLKLGTITTSDFRGVIVRGFADNWVSYRASGANPSGGNMMMGCKGAGGLGTNFYLPDFLSTIFIRCRSESRDVGHALGTMQRGWYLENAATNVFLECSCEDAYSIADWHVVKAARCHWIDSSAGTHIPKPAAAVFTDDGGVFTDETADASDADAGDVVLRPDPAAVNDALYVGSTYRFLALQVVISTAATDGTVAWEYWDGSAWTALGATDNTNAFQNAGTRSVVWTEPQNWATTSVNGSSAMYFVRARVTGGTSGALATTLKLASSGVGVLLDDVDASEWTRGHVSAHPSGTTFHVKSNCNGFHINDVGLEDGYSSVVDAGMRTRIRVYGMPGTNFGTYTIYPARGERSGVPRVNVTTTTTVDPLRYGVILVDTTAGAINLTLSTPGGLPGEGLPVKVYNVGNPARTLTILSGANDRFNVPGSVGATSVTLTGQGHCLSGTYTDNGDGTNTLHANRITS